MGVHPTSSPTSNHFTRFMSPISSSDPLAPSLPDSGKHSFSFYYMEWFDSHHQSGVLPFLAVWSMTIDYLWELLRGNLLAYYLVCITRTKGWCWHQSFQGLGAPKKHIIGTNLEDKFTLFQFTQQIVTTYHTVGQWRKKENTVEYN